MPGPSPSDVLQHCVVLGRPRSGTTVFKDMLHTHPAVFSLGEIFNESNQRSYFHFRQERIAEDRRAALPSQALDNFDKYLRWCADFARRRKPDTRVLVLDVKYDQAHLLCDPWWRLGALPKIFTLIRERGWKVIDIHRRNIAAQVISNQLATRTKIYHSTNLEPGSAQTAKVHINAQHLVREVAMTANAYRRVTEHFRGFENYLHLFYEEMFADDGRFARELLERLSGFLALDNMFDATPKLTKLLDKDLLVHVENAGEIAPLLQKWSGE